MTSRTDSYDYIIIGGGASGCALAGVLSRQGRTLLLERGKRAEEEPLTQTDSGWPRVLASSATERQRVKDGGWAFLGNVLGGGTSINAGIFLKEPGRSEFLDQHSHLIKQEVGQSYQNISKVAFQRYISPVGRTIIEGMIGAGIGQYHASTDVSVKGVFSPYSIFDSRGVRHSAAHLLPREGETGFDNLNVQTQSLAIRVLFSTDGRSPRAIGIEYLDLKKDPKGPPKQALLNAGGETIVSAGAIHSPKILMLSGIGDRQHLKGFNIQPVVNNPHVGLHLMDQPALALLIQSRRPVERTLVDIAAVTDQIHFEQVSGGDISTVLASAVGALLPARARSPKNLATIGRVLKLLAQRMRDRLNQAIIMAAILKHPITEGSVRLTTADPQGRLEIDSAKLLHGSEKEAMIGALRILRKFFETSSIKETRRDTQSALSRFLQTRFAKIYGVVIRLPIGRHFGNSVVTYPPLPDLDFEDHDLEKKKNVLKWLNMMTIEGWHYAGTCQFGKVVDEDFKVIGTTGLRVVDASVLKRPPTVNPQSTLMMLGDYAGRVSMGRKQTPQLEPVEER